MLRQWPAQQGGEDDDDDEEGGELDEVLGRLGVKEKQRKKRVATAIRFNTSLSRFHRFTSCVCV